MDYAGADIVYTFDPYAERWIAQARMGAGRWYPSQVRLFDGRTAILGGYTGRPPGGIDSTTAEIFTPGPGAGDLGTIAPAGSGAAFETALYPHLTDLPDGRVLLSGPAGGDYALIDAAGERRGFDVARMQSYEVHGQRVSSSAVRAALAAGDMARTAALLGRPYAVSGHVLHGRKLGRSLGCRTLNLRFGHPRPDAMGIFAVHVHGLAGRVLRGVASLGVRPSVEDNGRVLLETHCLDWPLELGSEGGYGRLVRVELLHKLHDERRYDSLDSLALGVAQDVAEAQAWFATAK